MKRYHCSVTLIMFKLSFLSLKLQAKNSTAPRGLSALAEIESLITDNVGSHTILFVSHGLMFQLLFWGVSITQKQHSATKFRVHVGCESKAGDALSLLQLSI